MKNSKNIRTCIACRKKIDKQNEYLIKVTLVNDKVVLNNGEYFGRSCYICDKEECKNKVKKHKLLSKIFKRNVDEEIYNKLDSLN